MVRPAVAVLMWLPMLVGGCAKPQSSGAQAPPAPADDERLEAVSRAPERESAIETSPPMTAPPRTEPSYQPPPAPPRPPPAPPADIAPEVRTHVVAPGETLWSIADRYYRDGRAWRRLYSANRNRISDPRDLPVGLKLIVP